MLIFPAVPPKRSEAGNTAGRIRVLTCLTYHISPKLLPSVTLHLLHRGNMSRPTPRRTSLGSSTGPVRCAVDSDLHYAYWRLFGGSRRSLPEAYSVCAVMIDRAS